jgi:hypothetical protein
MPPRMTSDLMSLSYHPLDNRRIARCRVIDPPFAQIVARDEEGCLGIIARKHIKDVRSIKVRPIIERKCHDAGLKAIIDSAKFYATTAIKNIADVRTRYGRCACSGRRDVGIAARAVVVLTVRGFTVFLLD